MEKKYLISQIKKAILQEEPGAEIILYGSFARGDNDTDSDLDILVLLEKENITNEDERKIASPLYDLGLQTNQIISPLIRSKKTWLEKYPNTPLFMNIKKEGIRI